MATLFTGGCMCGAIRYECSAEPIAMGKCHCRDCQRAMGSAFAPALIVPRSALTITGEVKYYDGIGDSGTIVSRGFCSNCGSRLFSKPVSVKRYHFPIAITQKPLRFSASPSALSALKKHIIPIIRIRYDQ